MQAEIGHHWANTYTARHWSNSFHPDHNHPHRHHHHHHHHHQPSWKLYGGASVLSGRTHFLCLPILPLSPQIRHLPISRHLRHFVTLICPSSTQFSHFHPFPFLQHTHTHTFQITSFFFRSHVPSLFLLLL